jgi:hypothetical protein
MFEHVKVVNSPDECKKTLFGLYGGLKENFILYYSPKTLVDKHILNNFGILKTKSLWANH